MGSPLQGVAHAAQAGASSVHDYIGKGPDLNAFSSVGSGLFPEGRAAFSVGAPGKLVARQSRIEKRAETG
jgi:hypothetical protein